MAKESGNISQKEYLQKYLSDNNEDKKKKKKFKVLSSSRIKRSQIIDDDIDIKNMQPLDDDDVELYQLDEDAPQIAGIIDERPAELRAQEYYSDKKRWKVFASGDADGDITVVENKEMKKVEEKDTTKKDNIVKEKRNRHNDGVEKNYEKIIKTTLGLKSRRTVLYKDLESSKQDSHSETKQEKVISSSNKNKHDSDSDTSPPRRKRLNSDSDPSPPRVTSDRKKSTQNYSSDSDPSPPRKSLHKSRKHSDSDLSPPRVSSLKKKESNDSDASPPRKSSHNSRKHGDSDLSPPRVSSLKKKENNDSDASPPRKFSRKSRKHSDSDFSPPRMSSGKKKKNYSDTSPPRKFSQKNRKHSDSDSSPPRVVTDKNKRYSDSDSSPPRKFSNKHRKDSKPSLYKNSESDTSPPRRSSTNRYSSSGNKNKYNKEHNFFDVSEKSYKNSSRQRGRNFSQKLMNSKHSKNSKSVMEDEISCKNRNKYSPPRKNKKGSDSDFSPPRKSQKKGKYSSDSDVTPPRKSNKKSYSISCSTKNIYDQKNSKHVRQSDEYDSDNSVKRKSSKSRAYDRHQTSVSPKRHDDRKRRDYTYKRNLKENSPKRRKHGDSISPNGLPSDEIKVQKSNEKYRDTYEGKSEHYNKSKRSRDRSPKQSRDSKMKTTLEGKQAGLQDATAMKKELLDFKNRENQMYAQMDASVSGLGAAPIMRDRKTGRKRDLEKEKEREEEKAAKAAVREEKYSRWGKGVKQVEDAEERLADTLKEMSKPLARYANDKDLDDFLKAQEREGDPMLEYIRSKQKESTSLTGSKPAYKGAFMPNRFGIRPGHRWDGVDRSNGFEKKWFTSKNARKAVEEEAYKWSTSDM